MVSTVLAACTLNVLLAYGLVSALGRGGAVVLDEAVQAGIAVVALGSTAAATLGWRNYLRRRRGDSQRSIQGN